MNSNMGKQLGLGDLTKEECERVIEIIQKDLELRQKEKETLSKIEEEVSDEEGKASLLTRNTKFNKNCCIRCCETFGIIFNRKQTCQMCKLFVRKSCCQYVDDLKGYVCSACMKQIELKLKSCDWFYNNVSHKFKRFGSAKVDRTLYKHTADPHQKAHCRIKKWLLKRFNRKQTFQKAVLKTLSHNPIIKDDIAQ